MTPLFMVHKLEKRQVVPFPSGFRFRLFHDDEDIKQWAEILTQTHEFNALDDAIDRFNEEFLHKLEEVRERMIFLETDEGKSIGTATAWYGLRNGIVIGRLHWVEIIPEYQGRGLGRPLITKALSLLKEKHETAYLKTQVQSEAAIHLYQNLGWVFV